MDTRMKKSFEQQNVQNPFCELQWQYNFQFSPTIKKNVSI